MEDIIKKDGDSYDVNGYEYFDKEEVKAEIENAKLLYKPEFIPFYLKEIKEYGFNNTEGLVYGFMRFYLSNNPRGQFYFTNEQLAYMLDVSPRTITRAISKVLDCGEFEATYKVKADGGTFRLVKNVQSGKRIFQLERDYRPDRLDKNTNRLDKGVQSDWTKMTSLTRQNCLPNNNKVKENKINVSKDTDKSSYGNKDINTCIEYLKEKVGGQLDGTEKSNRQYCYNLIRKIKKGYPDLDAVEQVKIVIDIATADPFHSKNATSFQYLFYNFVKIIKQAKENTNRVVEIK